MIARTLMTVLALLIGGNCADAGLIVSHELLTAQPSEAAVENLLLDMIGSVDNEPQNDPVFKVDTESHSEMAGSAGQSPTTLAVLSLVCSLVVQESFLGKLGLANSKLPASTVLDGRLKPS